MGILMNQRSYHGMFLKVLCFFRGSVAYNRPVLRDLQNMGRDPSHMNPEKRAPIVSVSREWNTTQLYGDLFS